MNNSKLNKLKNFIQTQDFNSLSPNAGEICPFCGTKTQPGSSVCTGCGAERTTRPSVKGLSIRHFVVTWTIIIIGCISYFYLGYYGPIGPILGFIIALIYGIKTRQQARFDGIWQRPRFTKM